MKELDAKNNILTKLLDENVLRKFSLPHKTIYWRINKRTVQRPRKFT